MVTGIVTEPAMIVSGAPAARRDPAQAPAVRRDLGRDAGHPTAVDLETRKVPWGEIP